MGNEAPGAVLSVVTYLDVTCLIRSGVALMGMDKKVGLECPKGDELMELTKFLGERSVQGKGMY